MKIKINPNRYQQLMTFIDTKFSNPENNKSMHQRLKTIGIVARNENPVEKSDLTDRQVELLQYLIASNNHSAKKLDLYFCVYGLYNRDVRNLNIHTEYEADLIRLESLHVIQSQDDHITLASPTPKINNRAISEREDKTTTPDFIPNKKTSSNSTSKKSIMPLSQGVEIQNEAVIQALQTHVKELKEKQF